MYIYIYSHIPSPQRHPSHDRGTIPKSIHKSFRQASLARRTGPNDYIYIYILRGMYIYI